MQPEYGWRAVSGGVDAAGNQWLAYSGMTLAPLSPNIYSDGWHCASVEAMGNIRMIGVPNSGDCGTLQTAACRYRSERVRVDHSY